MSTQLHDAATWPRSVRQHIEAIAATLMLGLQVFRERAMNLGGSLAAIVNSDAKDEKIRRLEVELDLHRRRFRSTDRISHPKIVLPYCDWLGSTAGPLKTSPSAFC